MRKEKKTMHLNDGILYVDNIVNIYIIYAPYKIFDCNNIPTNYI